VFELLCSSCWININSLNNIEASESVVQAVDILTRSSFFRRQLVPSVINLQMHKEDADMA